MAAAIAVAKAQQKKQVESLPVQANFSLSDPLPDPDQRRKEGILLKKCFGETIQWHDRTVVATLEGLLFARPEADQVIDYIPLLEITSIIRVDQEKDDKPAKTITVSNEDPPSAFVIRTAIEGHNNGKAYYLDAGTEAAAESWILDLNGFVKDAKLRKKLATRGTILARLRNRVRTVYNGTTVQSLVALVIMASFGLNIASNELLPEDGTETAKLFEDLDLIFTVIFTFELSVNMFAHWFVDFVSDSWNLFDAIVVAISLLSLGMSELPAVNMLRLIRVFRVIRLFRALKSLRQIINALTASIFPVMSSFLVLLLITCIYAMLATTLFGNRSPQFFGNFSHSLFTMFQVCTGDSWGSVVTRGLFPSELEIDRGAALFLLSYVLIAGIVLVNIVVAVLLDNFITSVTNEKAEEKAAEEAMQNSDATNLKGVLDPLLHQLSRFASGTDLSERIKQIYKMLDIDDSGGLSFEEFRDGLKKLPINPQIHLSPEDFDMVTEGRTLCNDDQELDENTFEIMMIRQIQMYSMRQLTNSFATANDNHIGNMLLSLKILSLDVAGFFSEYQEEAEKLHILHQDQASSFDLRTQSGLHRAKLAAGKEHRLMRRNSSISGHSDLSSPSGNKTGSPTKSGEDLSEMLSQYHKRHLPPSERNHHQHSVQFEDQHGDGHSLSMEVLKEVKEELVDTISSKISAVHDALRNLHESRPNEAPAHGSGVEGESRLASLEAKVDKMMFMMEKLSASVEGPRLPGERRPSYSQLESDDSPNPSGSQRDMVAQSDVVFVGLQEAAERGRPPAGARHPAARGRKVSDDADSGRPLVKGQSGRPSRSPNPSPKPVENSRKGNWDPQVGNHFQTTTPSTSELVDHRRRPAPHISSSFLEAENPSEHISAHFADPLRHKYLGNQAVQPSKHNATSKKTITAGSLISLPWAQVPQQLFQAQNGWFDPTNFEMCDGCSLCYGGFRQVGVLPYDHRSLYLTVYEDHVRELRGSMRSISGDIDSVLEAEGQRCMELSGIAAKFDQGSSYVDCPHSDGRHGYRCYFVNTQGQVLECKELQVVAYEKGFLTMGSVSAKRKYKVDELTEAVFHGVHTSMLGA